ncbi:MAG: DUF2127 domain-containing protein [Phycisphaerales bacterium]|nr:DUF2127 domain-containing protein [Phycisphaerales bacterium]
MHESTGPAFSPSPASSRKKPLERVHGHSLIVVRLIAAGKLAKAAGLLVLAMELHYLIAPESHRLVADYLDALRPDPYNKYLYALLEQLLALQPATLHWLRVGSFVYAGLYALEGIGLIFDKGWAEWLLIITTAGFVPLEIYEIYEQRTWPRLVIFGLNVVILVYISMRLRWRYLARRQARATGMPVVIPHETTKRGIKP